MKIRIALCAAVLALPSAALAQVGTTPFGGLFGRTPERVGKEFTAIEFRTSGGGQFDDGLLQDDSLPADQAAKGGYTAGMNAGLAFGRHTTRSQVDLHGVTSYQEYLSPRDFGATSYEAGGKAMFSVTQRLSIDAASYYTRSPFFQVLPSFLTSTPEWGAPPEIVANPFAARLLLNEIVDVGAGVTDRYAKHGAISALGSRRTVRFKGQSDGDYDMNAVEAGWKHSLRRDLGLHFSYRREDYRYLHNTDTPRFVHEYLDLGVDFDRALTIARRTTFGFSTRTAMVNDGSVRKFRLNGDVNLTKWFARTWHASIQGQRTTEVVPGFIKPLFADMADMTIEGMLSDRLEWFARAGGGQGRLGFEAGGNPFVIGTALSRLNFALTRRLAAYVQYSFYHYELPPSTESVSLLNRVSRQSVVVGLNVWVPIYQQVRTPSGPQ